MCASHSEKRAFGRTAMYIRRLMTMKLYTGRVAVWGEGSTRGGKVPL